MHQIRYSAPPDPLAVLKGPTTKRREGERERGREGEEKGRGGEERGGLAPNWGAWIRQCPPLVLDAFATTPTFAALENFYVYAVARRMTPLILASVRRQTNDSAAPTTSTAGRQQRKFTHRSA